MWGSRTRPARFVADEEAVECFLAQRKSEDGVVHSTGECLMVEGQEMAHWNRHVVFIQSCGVLSDRAEGVVTKLRCSPFLHNLAVVEMRSK